MPRVRPDRLNYLCLTGLNHKRSVLADGSVAHYWTFGKGGPRLPGEYASAEFLAAYLVAKAAKREPPAGVLLSIMSGYQASTEFTRLSPRTRADYVKQILVIEKSFADFPLAALSDRRTRGVFLAWRDELAARSRRQADYAWAVLARILSWAVNRGLVATNPCARGGRVYRGTRAEKVWTTDDEAAFLAKAPPRLQLALLLALWTGQRQGDLLALSWTAYDGAKIRLRQGKTGARVAIPVGAPLRLALEAAAQSRGPATTILTTSDGHPWKPDGFRTAWRRACEAAGVAGVTFNDLRGTAVTRLAIAGCTEAEIATITGHSLRDVRSILDAHYLNRDPALAENAIRKLEAGTKIPERAPERR